jgi:exopolyphosphatase/guanosine-5'-triphosphate,3'-diphosphate pyrophosphatase
VRVAAVDLGTNSTRLLVADVEDGRSTQVVRRLTITRLGQEVDRRRALHPDAIARVTACLDVYRDELEQLGALRTLAIATSALRDAADARDFLRRVESDYGFSTRLLGGAEEAALAFRGVSSERRVDDGTLLVDIGGGSTELVLGGAGGVSFSTSLQLGCVRLTERYLHSDPPTEAELAACAEHVRAQLPALEPAAAIGVAGTVTTIAALDLDLVDYDPDRVHGHLISRAAVERELARLAAMTHAARAAIPTIEPGRASVIVAGAVILDEVLRRYGLDTVEASERDILDGAALAAAELPPLP